MTEPLPVPLTTEPPADTDPDPEFDEPVEGADELPDDVRNDDLSLGQPPGDPADGIAPLADTNTDAPVAGTPIEGEIDDAEGGAGPT